MKQYFDTLHEALDTVDVEAIQQLTHQLVTAWRSQKTVFIFGNGGSAATASHFVCDLSKLTIIEGEPRFKAMALTDNMPLVTAWANDTDYSNVFKEQLATFVTEGDVVLGISASGNSINVLNAIKYAKEIGAITAAVSGFQGGKVKELVDISIVTYSNNMQLIEDSHSVLCHAISLQVLATIGDFAKTGQFIYDQEIDLKS